MRDVAIQNDRLSVQVADQRLILRQQTLHNLMNGYVERGGGEYLASAGMNAQTAWYTAAYVTLYLEGNEPHTLVDGDVWTLPDAKAYIIGLKDANRIAILFNHAGGEAQRADLAAQAIEQLALRTLTVQSMGMGASYRRLEDIALSFLQAQAVAHEEDQTRKVCLFESARPGSMHASFMPVSDKLLLCQCIRRGEADIALSTLEKMRADVSALAQTPSVVRSWCFFVYDAVLNVLEELGLPDMVERMPRLEIFAAPDTLCQLIKPILRETCERVQREEKQQKKDLQASILQYVSEHFHEQEMSLEYLGSVFQLSESYLTRFFRKRTGQSFLQYISELRMDKVKRLLAETELPIKDIVTQAGYVDVANFTRKFRQQEGCTPGNWRQAQLLEGEEPEQRSVSG
ncbi:MAG TPA: AraC family transcriptional regulator [Clostridia bacterium]|nr:AraC family transcriptional regulator [Clostridia bacterium]